jgi:hypothetical protein
MVETNYRLILNEQRWRDKQELFTGHSQDFHIGPVNNSKLVTFTNAPGTVGKTAAR